MRYTSTAVRRGMRTIGGNIRNQRKLLGLTVKMVAERSGISVTTLSKLENGQGAGLDATLAVLNVLGMLDRVVTATDPYETDVGRLRAAEKLPERVRVPKFEDD
ncbi:helix-turn-helix domain-containing protein [Corynebacterium aquatimens]|uniref:Transcriptional regulator with XRE-family HTH domain n=1 Tax=Corynebacterium aquatimens TaxID=1190508 RepID=A0A931E3A2_9CORY|nr:helix-turn-helix transcriptional regulator [Corynebacterium aquatimens]MBG6121713.1 transcriptional regulator with XRE-family HTH domain [Corynebacterium aquatimens]